VYKGLKSTEAKPGEWVVISGVGGLGHLAVQYAKAMGFRVAAVDVSEEKLALARKLGAKLTVNAKEQDPAAFFQKEIGGAKAVLVTAPSTGAFAQAIGMTRARGTIVLNGLPPGSFPLPIFEVVLKALTIRGSIVGTRLDLPRQSLSQERVWSAPPRRLRNSKTSTISSSGCTPVRSMAALCWTSLDHIPPRQLRTKTSPSWYRFPAQGEPPRRARASSPGLSGLIKPQPIKELSSSPTGCHGQDSASKRLSSQREERVGPPGVQQLWNRYRERFEARIRSGAGPAGLFAAQKIALAGHEVFVFNRNVKPGGLAEYGIYPVKTTMKLGLRRQFSRVLSRWRWSSSSRWAEAGNVGRLAGENGILLAGRRLLGWNCRTGDRKNDHHGEGKSQIHWPPWHSRGTD
jgi:hypothetical protein